VRRVCDHACSDAQLAFNVHQNASLRSRAPQKVPLIRLQRFLRNSHQTASGAVVYSTC
jgi:hypothetical protein